MKIRMHALIAFFCAMLVLATGAQGAIQVPALINGTMTQPVLAANGDLLMAIDFGTTDDIVLNGIPFDGWSPTASGSVYTGNNLAVTITSGNGSGYSSYGNLYPGVPVWTTENYLANEAGPNITSITGLIAGRTYRVQMMNCDGRGANIYDTPLVNLKDSTGYSVDVDYNFGSPTTPFALLTAIVTNATSLTITMPTATTKSPQLVGLVIHDITNGVTAPVPANGQGLSLDPLNPMFEKVPTGQVLSWAAPVADGAIDPTSLKYRVYADPNQVKVQTGGACQFIRDFDAATSFDPTGDLNASTVYYWKVDTQLKYVGDPDPNTIPGLTWSFKTKALNNPAQIEAGPSIVTWLEAAQAGFVLDQPVWAYPVEGDETIVWTAVPSNYPNFPAPAVSFDDAGVLNPTVMIDKVGIYLLKVVSSDGVNPDQSDLIQVTVYKDACEAAKNNPVTPYVKLPYDLNGDCQETLADMSLFAAQWLTHNYAESAIIYNAGTLNPVELLLWLDASDSTTLTVSGTQVTRWNDKSGNGYYLEAGGAAGNPMLVANSLNGKPIVDFGTAYGDGTSGKWMQFKDTAGANLNLSTIRSVFWVMKGGNFMLGDDNNYHFHRGASEIAADGFIWSNSYAHANIRNGRTYLNGAQINGTTTRLPTVYSQISLVTNGNVEASNLCRDRSYRSGGQQIAEILIFNRPLTDAERLTVQQYLKGKWGTP